MSFLPTLALALLVPFAAPVGDSEQSSDRLAVGSPAPPLSIEHWTKGEPVTELEKGKVYLVEFWATWCKPCIEGFEHLSELQEKYADDLIVICVSDEPQELVDTFLAKPKWDVQTRFRITTDPDGSMRREWMTPARQPGLPTAFIIDREGIIRYIGHTSGMDYSLHRVVTGEEPDEADFEMPDMADMLLVGGVHTPAAVGAIKTLQSSLASADGPIAFEQKLVLKGALKMGGPEGDAMDLTVSREGRLLNGGDLGWRVEATHLMAIPGMPGGGMREKETLLISGNRLIVKRASDSMFAPPPLPGDGWYEISRRDAAEFSGKNIQPVPVRLLMDPNPELSSPLDALAAVFSLSALDVVPEPAVEGESETETGRIVLAGNGAPFLGMPAQQSDTGRPPEVAVRVVLEQDGAGPITVTIGDPAEPQLVMTVTREPAGEALDPALFSTGDEGIDDLKPVLMQKLEEARSMRMSAGPGR